MLKKFSTIIFILALCPYGYAGIHKISRDDIAPNALRDSIELFLLESEQSVDSLPLEAAIKAEKARRYADILEMKEQEAFASKILGNAKMNLEEYYEAAKYLQSSLQFYTKTKEQKLTGDIHFLLGKTEYYLANYTKSLDHYLKALQIFKVSESKSDYANTLQNMGLLFVEMDDLTKALEYTKAALAINIELGTKKNIAGIYQNLGIISFKNNDDSSALEYYNKSIEYFREKHNLQGIGISYSNIGLIHIRNNLPQKAYTNFEKSLTCFTKTGFKLGQMWAHHNIGATMRMKRDFAESEKCFFRSLNYANELNSPEGITSNYQELSILYEKTGNQKKALEYLKKYTHTKDSLNHINSKEKIAELESLYKLESNEREQAELISENKRQKTQIWAISGFLTILILAILVILTAYYQKRKAERKLAEHKRNLENLVDMRTKELKHQISERKIAEESDKLKSAFLANMSHELRTPMNAIIAFSNFLREPNLNDDRKFEYLDHITTAGDSLLRLIDDIIDIAKIESKQLKIFIQPTNINRLLNELYKVHVELKGKNKIKQVKFNLKTDFKYNYIINTDSQRLKQVLSNLIENAFKYTDNGKIDLGFECEDKNVTFFVSDTGIGIPKDKHRQIFDRFYQLNHLNDRKTSGTGLGLAICKNLVNLLGGEIWLESTPKIGSTFYIRIPVDSVKKQLIPRNREDAKGKTKNLAISYNWNNKTILVAEDEDLNYKVLDTCLSRTNAQVIRAIDGATAIEICKNQKIDVVLMDIQMPGMDGYEATQEIKKMNNRTPVIVQTSFAMAGEKEKCLQAGCDDFVSKPLNIEVLLKKIEHFIR
jgi:signal transduction histidine kinase